MATIHRSGEGTRPTIDSLDRVKRSDPNRPLPSFGTGLATNSDSSEPVPWGHANVGAVPVTDFFCSLATGP